MANVQWTGKQIETLRTLREEGCDFDEISEYVGHSPNSCQRTAAENGIYKSGRSPITRHTGVTDDGPELNHRKNGRPLAGKLVMHPCICCRVIFKSWDRTKNQICSPCKSLDTSPNF